MLKQRIITAIIMVIVIGSCILWLPVQILSIVFAGLLLIAAWEWSAFAGFRNSFLRIVFTLTCGLLMLICVNHSQLFSLEIELQRIKDIMGLACLWWSIALLWVLTYPSSASIWNSVPMRLAMGLLTLVPAWLALVYLRVQEEGVALIFILIGIVVSADTGAYFSGRKWGRAKLAVAVSPGKSWAGFWGGLLASSIFSVLVWLQWWQTELGFVAVMCIALATSLSSVLGDLLESMMKRERGIKDSGRILPGHGGIMDRLDSITAASPVFALSLILIGGA